MGGSTRIDVESSTVLRPLSVVALGIALYNITPRLLLENKSLFLLIAAFISLHLIYLLPVFSSASCNFLFHEISKLLLIDEEFCSQSSLSVSRTGSLNGFFSIFLPISVIILSLQVSEKQKIYIFKLFLFLGCVGAILGAAQVLTPTDRLFYLYRISNYGSSVGFFANRNHQAVFLALLFPMLAVYALSRNQPNRNINYRAWAAMGCCVVLIPLILITGSRAGFLVGVAAIIASLILYNSERRTDEAAIKSRMVLVTAGAIGLGLITAVMSRAEAWDRFFSDDEATNGRLDFWASTIDIMTTYTPFGIGPGGFPSAFALVEPHELIDSTYLNHAHNDWLEWFATFGLFGIALILVAIALLLYANFLKFKLPIGHSSSRSLGKAGLVIIVLIALASLGDYPIRTPIISVLFALSLAWTMSGNARADRASKMLT